MNEYGWIGVIAAIVTSIGAAVVAVRRQKIEGAVILDQNERDHYGQLIKDMRDQYKVSINALQKQNQISVAQLTKEIDQIRQKCERIDTAERKCREDFIKLQSEFNHTKAELEDMRKKLQHDGLLSDEDVSLDEKRETDGTDNPLA